MKFVALALVTAMCVALPAGVVAAGPIKEIAEAGINGCEEAPDTIGPQFFAHVQKSCTGKPKCTVAPVDIFPATDLAKWKCVDGFFILANCGGENNEEFSSGDVTKSVSVQCPG